MMIFGLNGFATPSNQFPPDTIIGTSRLELLPHFRGLWADFEDVTWQSISSMTWEELFATLEITKDTDGTSEMYLQSSGDLARDFNFTADAELYLQTDGSLNRANDYNASAEMFLNTTGSLSRVLNFYDYLSQLRSNTNQHVVRLELLRQDETVLQTFESEILSGSVTTTLVNGIRRSCDITLVNVNNTFKVNEFQLWFGRKFRIKTGLLVGDEEFLFSQGVFVMTNVENANNQSNTTVRLSGRDKWSLLDGSNNGVLQRTTVIPVDSDIEEVLDDILEDVNDPKFNQINFESTTLLTPSDLRLESGDNYGNMVSRLATFLGRDAYFDVNGRFTMEEPRVPSERSSVFTFDKDNVYQASTVRYEFPSVFNVVQLNGANLDNGVFVQAEAVNDDPTSPSSTVALNGVRKVKVVNSDVVVTDAQAQISANYELSRVVDLRESIVVTATKIYHLDVGDIIRVDDPENLIDFNTKYEINNITMGIMPQDNMTIQATRARRFVV